MRCQMPNVASNPDGTGRLVSCEEQATRYFYESKFPRAIALCARHVETLDAESFMTELTTSEYEVLAVHAV